MVSCCGPAAGCNYSSSPSSVQLAALSFSFLYDFFLWPFPSCMFLNWYCPQLDTVFWINVLGVVHINNSVIHRLGDLACHLQIFPGHSFVPLRFHLLRGRYDEADHGLWVGHLIQVAMGWITSLPGPGVFKGRLHILLKESWDKFDGKYSAREEATLDASLVLLMCQEGGHNWCLTDLTRVVLRRRPWLVSC